MLAVSSADLRLPPSADGFAWWYCDVIDPVSGDGLVVVGSVGLPFVPRRSGRREPAIERPSLSISAYRGGREHFYLLAAGCRDDSYWDAARGHFRIGASELRIDRDGRELRFRADLDAPLPGRGRLRGVVELGGTSCEGAVGALGDASAHAWSPLATACDARAVLQLGDAGRFDLHGRGYLDGNRSDLPLGALGIEDWRWGRVAFPDHELVWFRLRPPEGPARALLLHVARDGSVRVADDPEIAIEERRTTLFGLRRTASVDVRSGGEHVCTIRYSSLVDDGPFYQRYLVAAVDVRGARGRGFAERVVPARVDVPWQRPFIEMRVQRQGEAGSRWLPLFAGPRRGRLRRLVSSWAQRMAGT